MQVQPALERTLQRHNAYAFLSDVYLYGLTPDTFAQSRLAPALQEVLPAEFEADEAGADHEEAFGFNVLPYAGVFLTEDGQLGGSLGDTLQRIYGASGFDAPADFSPDHIGCQLAYLSHVTAVEIDADKAMMQSEARRRQRDFMQTHLVPWLPGFTCALKLHNHAFYGEIADLTQALVISHLAELPGDQDIKFELPAAPDILADSKTGIKEIMQFLARPSWSGVFFSRKNIRSLGSVLQLPAGFGDRAQMLNNAFQSAINYDQVGPFVAGMILHVEAFTQHYTALRAQDAPALKGVLQEWISRTHNTHRILEKLKAA